MPVTKERKHLLLVEDEVIIAMEEKQNLEQYGYDVTSVNSGEKAIILVKDGKPIDLILMDIDLGRGIDGPETAKEILKSHNIPVVFLSSHTNPEIVEKTDRITSYGYVVKNSGMTVLDASIKMAFKLFQANKQTKIEQEKLDTFLDIVSDTVIVTNKQGVIVGMNTSAASLFSINKESVENQFLDETIALFDGDDQQPIHDPFNYLQSAKGKKQPRTYMIKRGRKKPVFVMVSISELIRNDQESGLIFTFHDITKEQENLLKIKKSEELYKNTANELENQILSLTKPFSSTTTIEFEDLFVLNDIQNIQDQFAQATGVASIITKPDGSPITKPSNFCRLCMDIIRTKKIGKLNCFKSDAKLGVVNKNGPAIQPCLSGGLWDAGSAITVGNQHVANWLIGQVRDSTQSEKKIRAYADKIGADPDEAAKAFTEVPAMSFDKFKLIAEMLFSLANLISNIAYKNVVQARFINEKNKAEVHLLEQESINKTILSNISDVIAIINRDQTIRYVSPNITKLFGWKPEELIGKSCWVNIHKDNISFVQSQFANLIANENMQITGQFNHRQKNGIYSPIQLTAKNLLDDSSINGILASYHDITAQKLNEQALMESEERYKALHNATFGGIAIHVNGIILECNQGLAQLTGYSQSELPGMNCVSLIAPESREIATKQFMRGANEPYEVRGLRKNGGTYALHISAKNIPYKGEMARVLEFRDISKLKEAENKLIESEKKFRSLFENINIGVSLHEIILDEQGKPIDAVWLDLNPMFEKITDLKREEIIGKGGLETIPEITKEWLNHFAEIATSGEPTSFEYTNDQLELCLDIRVYSPKKNQFSVAIMDITERKKSEKALEAAFEEKKRLLQELQHRSKNSFNLISSLLGMMKRGDFSEDTKLVLSELNGKVMAFSKLYDLLFQNDAIDRIHLNKYLESIILSLPLIHDDIIVDLEMKGDIVLPVKEAIPIGIIAAEVITNSVKYAFPDSREKRITVQLYTDRNKIFLTIKDNGVGLPKSLDPKTDTSMGFTLIRALVQQIEGTSEITGDDGTTFALTLTIPG